MFCSYDFRLSRRTLILHSFAHACISACHTIIAPGLRSLDEPSVKQSDTAVLNLHLRQSSKHIGSQPIEVASISDPSTNQQRLNAWIKSIEELQKSKRNQVLGGFFGDGSNNPGNVDIENLMSEWTSEELITRMRHTASKIGNCDALSISEAVRVMCAMLDIPIPDETNVVEPLHVMMSLFLSFKDNPIYNPDITQYQG